MYRASEYSVDTTGGPWISVYLIINEHRQVLGLSELNSHS